MKPDKTVNLSDYKARHFYKIAAPYRYLTYCQTCDEWRESAGIEGELDSWNHEPVLYFIGYEIPELIQKAMRHPSDVSQWICMQKEKTVTKNAGVIVVGGLITGIAEDDEATEALIRIINWNNGYKADRRKEMNAVREISICRFAIKSAYLLTGSEKEMLYGGEC